MKLIRFLVLSAIIVLGYSSVLLADNTPTAQGSQNPTVNPPSITPSQIAELTKQSEPVASGTETTEAEKTQKAEQEFQGQLASLAKAIDSLQQRAERFHSQSTPPLPEDMDKLNKDLQRCESELTAMVSSDVSSLAQLQRSDLQDKLFKLKLSVQIVNQRWGVSMQVFGLDFFKNAPLVQSAGQKAVPASYKIRPGDKVHVLVLSSLGAQSDYDLDVDSTGAIVLAGAGLVHAAGRTAGQLRDILAGRLKPRFKQLRIELTVESVASIQVQVAGEVARPGTYSISGMSTVLSALDQAGGPTKLGTFRRIELSRDGEPKRKIDLYEYLLHGDRKQDVPLQDGDFVFVPAVGPTLVVAGEVLRPGRYEPDFPVALNQLLTLAGAAKPSGYLQTVQVARVVNNEYNVLLSEPLKSGDRKSTFKLQPGDEVTVFSVRSSPTNQVVVTGPVGSPGTYGLKDGMRVSDLIKVAQGLAPEKEVYMGRADILRIDSAKGTQIVAVNLAKAMQGDPEQNIALQKLDRLFVYEPDQVVFRPKLVSITGAVAKSGLYRRDEGMTVSDAIAAAGGTLPHAHLARADLLRKNNGETTELVRIDLQAALSGDPTANVKLTDRDELTVFTSDEVKWQNRTVRIEGAVQRSGVYQASRNMHVSDLIFASGGLLPEAGAVASLARCDRAGHSVVTKIDVSKLAPLSDDDMLLQDQDVVTVPSVNSYLRAPEIVVLSGEVVNPGPYALTNRDETLSDLISRAGGLTSNANAKGALFLRQRDSFQNLQQEQDADIILERARLFSDKEFLTQLAKMGVRLPENFLVTSNKAAEELGKPAAIVADVNLEKTTTATPDTSTSRSDASEMQVISALAKQNANSEQTTAYGPAITDVNVTRLASFEGRQKLATLSDSARISLDLSRALAEDKSPDNLPLRGGDRVFIPRNTGVVTVVGAVLQPHAFAAKQGYNADFYITRSGGYAQDASRNHVVVVRANGDALPKDKVRSVEEGDTIVVPNTGLIDITKRVEKLGSLTKVLSDVLSSAFILTRF